MTKQTITVNCPRVMPDGTPCEAPIKCELEYVPGEMYGQDADGNRGLWIGPSWEVAYLDTACADGHELTTTEYDTMVSEAEKLAADFEPEEYDGPDTMEEAEGVA